MKLDSHGQSRVSSLIFLMAAVLAVYVVIKIVPPYMHFYAMDDEVHQQLKLSKINNAMVIRDDILDKARELGLQFNPRNLELTYDAGGNLAIRVHWKEEVDFGYGFIKVFPFEIDTSRGDYEK